MQRHVDKIIKALMNTVRSVEEDAGNDDDENAEYNAPVYCVSTVVLIGTHSLMKVEVRDLPPWSKDADKLAHNDASCAAVYVRLF